MNIRKEFKIPEDNPFLNDKFSRRPYIDNLMKVVSTYDTGIVMSIDSSFGTGKTTFVKMWEAYLKLEPYRENFVPIYFNAWDNDDSLDPLIPLITTMSEQFKDERGISEIETNLKKVGSMLVKKAVPFALRFASHGLLNVTEKDIDNFTQKQLEDYAGKVGEAVFAEQKAKNDLKKEFKRLLEEYQEFMGKKVIVFIDELDRCRPLYAIEVLERIKHFFEIDNYIFILSMDKEQLSHSICTIYGNGMDSVGYLRRFIDIEFNLPEPNTDVYFDFLISQHDLHFKNMDYFWNLIKDISKVKGISLRDIDKLFINLKILFPLIDIFNEETNYKQVYIFAASNIYIFLMLLKITNPSDYIRILEKDYNIKEINNLLDILNVTGYKVNYNNLSTEFLTSVFRDSIMKFLEINSYNLENPEVYSEIMNSRYDRYSVGIGDGFRDENIVNLTILWKKQKQSTVINNLMFTNYANI